MLTDRIAKYCAIYSKGTDKASIRQAINDFEEVFDQELTHDDLSTGSERIINDYLKNEKPKWLATCRKVTIIPEQGKMVSLSFVHIAIKVPLYSISVGQHSVVSIVTL